MRRMLLLFAAVTLVAAVSIPAAVAARSKVPPAISAKAAEGTWTWVNTAWEEWKTTKDGAAYASGSEDGTWTGTFEGTSVDGFGAQLGPDGKLWALLHISFEGTVGDKTGTLEILTSAVVRERRAPMTGKWTIISGGGELANLRGQGTWAPGDDGVVHYTGIIKEYVPPPA